MSKPKDHGHLSLVGFVFQLLGSGVEAIEVYEEPDNPDEPSSLLVLERFGQDNAVLRNRLNQYKYSSTDDLLARPMSAKFCSDSSPVLQKWMSQLITSASY